MAERIITTSVVAPATAVRPAFKYSKDEKGFLWADEKHTKAITDKGYLINNHKESLFVDEKGRYINASNQLVDKSNHLVNKKRQRIDADGKLIKIKMSSITISLPTESLDWIVFFAGTRKISSNKWIQEALISKVNSTEFDIPVKPPPPSK